MMMRYINLSVIFSLILLGCPSLQGMQQLAKHAAHTVSHIKMQKGAPRIVQIAPVRPPIPYQAPALALQRFMQQKAARGMCQNMKAMPALPAHNSSSALICRQEIPSHVSSHRALPLFYRALLQRNMSHWAAAASQKASASGVVRPAHEAQAGANFELLLIDISRFAKEVQNAANEQEMNRKVHNLTEVCRMRIGDFAEKYSINYQDENGKTLLHHVCLMQKVSKYCGYTGDFFNNVQNIIGELNVDKTIQDNDGKTPIDYLMSKDHVFISKIAVNGVIFCGAYAYAFFLEMISHNVLFPLMDMVLS